MKLASPKLTLALVSAALLFAGCAKKPTRPDPGSTLVGQAGGPANQGLIQQTIPSNPLAPGLEIRDDFDPLTGQNRAALAANTVYFDFDQSAIKASEREKLKNAKEYLDKNPGFRLLLEGHCDWRGTAEYNLGLGDRRSGNVKTFLLSLGIEESRITTKSLGAQLATANAGDDATTKDRRVDFAVLK